MSIEKYDPLNETPYSILDSEGNIVDKEWKQSVSDDEMTEALKNMLFVRKLDEMAVSYQRQGGRMYTYPPHI